MIIGLPKEIKNSENRVALTPTGVAMLVKAGHSVLVEKDAGVGSGFTDFEYANSRGIIVDAAEDVWSSSDMIMKVKEPQVSEYEYFRKGLVLFTYLHLAAEESLTKTLCNSNMVAIAYETIQNAHGLPLLAPMSKIAGRMSVQVGAQFLEKTNGGSGILLGGVPGVPKGKVVILGGGTVGENAAKIAIGLGAKVTILDVNVDRLSYLENLFGDLITTLVSTPDNIAEEVSQADLAVGAVLIPGSKAPKLVDVHSVKEMSPGSVIVDVAVDQGGVFETIYGGTSHENPIYVEHDVIHYAVSNMPGAVPRTSTLALTNASLPFALEIANKGWEQALMGNPSLMKGLNVCFGMLTHAEVASTFNMPFSFPSDVLHVS